MSEGSDLLKGVKAFLAAGFFGVGFFLFGIVAGTIFGGVFMRGEAEAWSGMTIGFPLGFVLTPFGIWYGIRRVHRVKKDSQPRTSNTDAAN